MSEWEERVNGAGGDGDGPGAGSRTGSRRGGVGGMEVTPGAFQRRSRQRRQEEEKEEVDDSRSSTGRQMEPPGRTPPPRKAPQDAGWALHPAEHAWMLTAVDGSYDTILDFVSRDPHLLTRRDSVSGFTALHWLAKGGRDEALRRLVHDAEQRGAAVDVDVRGGGGVTPLHVASMQRRYAVAKLLVGAFGASVDAMDHGGRRAWQYLPPDAPPDMKELLGMWDDEHRRGGGDNANNNSSGGSGVEPGSGTEEETDRDPREQAGGGGEGTPAERTEASGGWVWSLRKMLPSFGLLGKRN